MTAKQAALALLCIAVVLLGVAWVAGQRPGGAERAVPRSLDAVRLGPDPGESIDAYLAGLPARLPTGAPVPALVQFTHELSVPDTVIALDGVVPATAVFRVPLNRVQTALRFVPLQPVTEPDPGSVTGRRLDIAQETAQRTAQREALRATGRAAAVARYEAGQLGTSCRCVLAVLVLGDRAALTALSTRPGVRAVDAAPSGTPTTGVALAPLLPEQTTVAAPVPDDGPVPEVRCAETPDSVC
ncbi:hypothetical protein [Pseudonocardia spinosispora]|uniref:hypothetical protein n=1 Tax=Pseudonocardia spinosispora TaxID=103441 RepID=UPI00041EE47F|nr:hypothetical protein [Pseudonocardia spinosispora]